MVRYTLSILVASDYTYQGAWKFENVPEHMLEFQEDQLDQALEKYNETVKELSLLAAIHGTAVKALLQDGAMGQKTIAELMYSGESVRFYYAAYQSSSGRWYIDQILGDVTYYAAMRPVAGITTMAIASTLDELQYQLGEDYNKYERLT